LADRAVALLERSGSAVFDVLVVDNRSTTAEVEKSSMKQASSVADSGVAIRTFDRGSQGFAYCSGHEMSDVELAVSRAVSQSKAGIPDPDFKGLPEARQPLSHPTLYDSTVASIQPDEAVEMLLTLVEAAGAHEKVHSVNAGLGVTTCELAIRNSNGLAAEQRMTSFDVFTETVAKDGNVMFSGLDYASGRRLDRSVLDRVGRSACEHAVRGLVLKKIETGDLPVILDPLAGGYVFAQAVGGGSNAETVQRSRSYLSGKLGQRIAAENLSVVDDPTLEWAPGSTSFDGEGTPASVTPVIESGTLSSYLHDSYTAGKDSVSSTGNSSRGGAVWSYRHPPVISFSNLVVRRGDFTVDEMVRETNRGVYLRLTLDNPNLATGELSGLMMESFLIEKGELRENIRQATIGIGLIEMFSRIDMVGKDHRNAFGVEMPAVRISSARVGGSA
ncbi:TPA: TldD/PmbA family protein, partial [Thermoplasmata archaeon]|nr:TldD/PmbA family protein [Thermoplasmata archaeon]